MWRDRWASIEIAAVIAAVIATSLWSYFATVRPSTRQIALLSEQARTACECEQASASVDGQGCWGAFEKEVAARGFVQVATACAPISTSSVCFREGEPCLVTKYRYVGLTAMTLCDARDAQAIDRTFSAVYDRTGDPDLAQTEADRVARAIASGQQVELASAKPGCAG